MTRRQAHTIKKNYRKTSEASQPPPMSAEHGGSCWIGTTWLAGGCLVENSSPVWEACRLQTRIAMTRERVCGHGAGPTGRFLRVSFLSQTGRQRLHEPRNAATVPPRGASAARARPLPASKRRTTHSVWRMRAAAYRKGSIQGRERCGGLAHAVCVAWLFRAGVSLPPGCHQTPPLAAPPLCSPALAALSRPRLAAGWRAPGTACRSVRHCHRLGPGVCGGRVATEGPWWWWRRPECLTPPPAHPIVGHHCIALPGLWEQRLIGVLRPISPPPNQHYPAVTRRRSGVGRSARTPRRRGKELCLAVWVGSIFFFLSSLSLWRWHELVQRRSTLPLPFVDLLFLCIAGERVVVSGIALPSPPPGVGLCLGARWTKIRGAV